MKFVTKITRCYSYRIAGIFRGYKFSRMDHYHKLKRKGFGNDQAPLCKRLKHSSLYFALANIFVVDRFVCILTVSSSPITSDHSGLGGTLEK